MWLVREHSSDFDRADLRDELRRAGFEECVAESIADRVDERKAHGWTYETGRQEAIRESQLIIDSSHAALDNFRGQTAPTRERPYDERERRYEPDRERRYDNELEREHEHESLSKRLFG